MSRSPPPQSAPSGTTALDPRIAGAEQRLAMLRELAELGMALARELTRRTLEGPEDPEAAPAAGPNPSRAVPGPRHDPAESFARLSRTVRLTLAQEALDALYERLIEGERYDAFVHRPLKEAVAAICDDLGLTPDWSRWTDDGWPPPGDGPLYQWELLWAPNAERIKKRRLQ